ncbi:MAG TPA: carboxypeptidase M32, partial [Limnochordia bacterium]
MRASFDRLREILAQVDDLRRAAALLSWDQQTYMPPQGAEARAEQLATLERLAQAALTQPEVGDLLAALEPWAASLPADSFEASLIRVTRREYDKLVKVPARLVAELARATALATDVWARARKDADFGAFRPHLERVVALTIEKADCLGGASRYDALLDEYEPDMPSETVDQLFQALKERLVPLVQAISERLDRIDDSVLRRSYPLQGQWEFGVEVLKAMGFDMTRGRQDQSPHPFTTSFSPRDVRVTTLLRPDRLAFGLFATIHEGGHGLYEQGIPWEFHRTPLAGGASLGVHESQSRLWENVIGRSRAFWRHFFPILQRMMPEQLADTDAETFYRAVNRVEPSFIRVEADEVTYTLHIFVRYDLERMLVEGTLSVADLPDAWNERMQAYLGLVPPDDGAGV